MTIDEARAAVRQAKENYKGAVSKLHSVVNPTDEELRGAQRYHERGPEYDSMDYEEGLLDWVLSKRESEADDEPEKSATA